MFYPKTCDSSLYTENEKNSLPYISIIIPVRNGKGRLESCLSSIQKQTYPKDRYEVIVANGRSTDQTIEIAKEFGAVVVDNPGIIQAAGKNAAIKAAKGELLAFTEDDCILPPDWLAMAEKYMRDDSVAGIGGPTLLPNSSTEFSKAVFILFRFASSLGYSVQSDVLLFDEAKDLPGGNVIYRTQVLEEAGPYNEELITAEDVDMNMRIVQSGYRLCYASELVTWHSKRDKPIRFFHQMRRFAIGRVKVGRYHKGALRSLHIFLAFIAPMVLVGTGIGFVTGYFVYVMVGGITVLAGLLLAGLTSSGSIKLAMLFLPVAAIFCVAWSIGFFSEIISHRKRANRGTRADANSRLA